MAEVAGSVSHTGNGRLNLARALADSGTDPVVPAGVTGEGGPIVGPYVAAANFDAVLQGKSNGSSTWTANAITGWTELAPIPLRVFLDNPENSAVTQQIVVEFDHTQGGTIQGIQDLTGFTATGSVTITAAPVLTSPPSGDKWNYTFTISMPKKTTGSVEFTGRMAAGAHLSTGNSLALGGSPSLGNLPINKPAPAAGTPDLTVMKTGPATATPGDTLNYDLAYSNKSTAADGALGVQLTDTLPAGVTLVPGSCGTCTVVGNTVTWDLGDLAVGASGSRTLQVTVPSGATDGTTYTNRAAIARQPCSGREQ